MERTAYLDLAPVIGDDTQGVLDAFSVEQLDIDTQTLLQTIEIGSTKLTTSFDAESRQAVIDARSRFFDDTLGWGDESHTLHTAFKRFKVTNPTAIPIDNFIQAQHYLLTRNVDVIKVIDGLPAAIGYSIDGIQTKMDNLSNLGIDAAKIVSSQPGVIGLPPESVREKVDNLSQLGIDAIKVINQSPNTLGFSQENIRAKMDALTELGLNAPNIINLHAPAVGYSTKGVQVKIDNFTSLGLDGVAIINKIPRLLGLSVEIVADKMANLNSLGLDGAGIVNYYPNILSSSADSIRSSMDNLSAHGLDAVKIVTAMPAVLALSSEGISTKIASLIESGLIKSGSDLPLETKSQINSFFIMPIESLLLYLADADLSTTNLDTLGYTAKQHVIKHMKATSTHERKKLYLEKLPELYSGMGAIAINHANYISIPKSGIQLDGRYAGQPA